jgi:teichuronic acid biosynthesis glycosyltransferase TuaG
MNPLVSIIMPTYNTEKYIRYSIESVISQTYLNWELIIIDDGSTDNTVIIVNEFIKKDSRIRYIYQNNAKQARARNNGIENAKGTILAFLDSDDLWLSTKLEKSILEFNTSMTDLLFTNSFITSDFLIDINNHNYKKMNVVSGYYSGNEALKLFIQGNRIPLLTVLVKKEKLKKIGGFNEQFTPAEDYDLWLRLLKNGCKFLAIDDVLSIYRLQQNSSTANDRLATKAVLLSIRNNFSNASILEFEALNFVKRWIKRWIKNYFYTTNDRNEIVKIIKSFDLLNIRILFLIKLYGFLKFDLIKKIILKQFKTC